ncbi:unnamed protein product [Rhizophagus irregularis]|nr:unnamed protein product [Rhizophagus irregularis]
MASVSLNEWISKKIKEGEISYLDYSDLSDLRMIDKESGVKRANWVYGRAKLALKVLINNPTINEDNMNKLLIELNNLMKVNFHPCINTFFGITKEPSSNNYMMALQYANQGNLRDYLKRNFRLLQWAGKIKMALDIARGLKCLHARNIVHRDLHAKNILIHKNRLMIADLGLSKQLTVEITSTSYVEPQFFTVANYVRNKKSDIYSLGVLLWEISSGYPPFLKIPYYSLIYKVSNGLREEPISDSPPEYVDLYQKCWDVDPNIRPTSDEVVDTLEYILSNIKEDSKIKEDMNISEDSKIIKNTEYTNITEDPNITNDSKITNDPMIKNDLIVTNDSKITHDQMITDDSKITNNLMISDYSKVANDPMIIDDSNVANDSIITNDPKIIISNDSTNTNDPIITNDSKITGDSKKDEKHDRSGSSPLREYKISKPLPLVYNNIEDESRLLSSILDEIVQVYLEYNNIGWTNNFDFDEVLEKYKSKARKIFDYLIENSNIKHYEVIIGKFYRKGFGIDRNDIIAFQWFMKANQKNDMCGHYEVGHCYYSGNGVTESNENAFRYYKFAANKGLNIAVDFLATCYEYGYGTQQDSIKAFELYKIAAKNGFIPSQYELGRCFNSGKGVQKSLKKALKWYKLYQKNNGISDVSSKIEEIEKELERGWFRRALKKPSSDSIFNL